MPQPRVSDEELRLDVKAYEDAGGNRSEAARMRKLPRMTYLDRLRMAETRFKITLGKIVDGRVDYVKAKPLPLPKGKQVFRYLLSSCQNNTFPHKTGLENLIAYQKWLHSDGDRCTIMLGSFSYQLDAYGAKAVKRGKHREPDSALWYAKELEPYICDESVQLAPGLIWCGEMNILPTTLNPLTGLDDYNGRNSNIVPHAKITMESVASLADEATKFNYSTGVITLRNYIQKRVGIIAERKHTYGATLVEVDSAGCWYVRQLHIGDDGVIYDIGPRGYRAVRISKGKVDAIPIGKEDRSFVEAITWGDIHAAEMELWVRDLGFGPDGMLDQLRPAKQFWHDIFSMRARGHHEIKNFHKTYQKFVSGEGCVEDEMQVTADFAKEAFRPWCETLVVRSNHDDHLDTWLNTANPLQDPLNARYHALLQHQLLSAMDRGERGFNILEWALRQKNIPGAIRFLEEDESYIICKDEFGGIECGLHGHLGPNGSRGSTRNLMKLGRPANKCHDHTATIRGQVYSAGACSLNFPYMRGPNGHSVSHIVTFENASRQIITFWDRKFRA